MLLVSLVPLHAQPAAPNRVLELDGNGSYVELPAKLFTNEVVTVEGWVKWREFGVYSRFFEFADASLQIALNNLASSASLQFQRFRAPTFADQTIILVPEVLSLNQWIHLAVVTGTNFSRLYVNGALLSTNEVPGGWQPGQLPPLKNLLGRSVMKGTPNAAADTELNGQMAEVRLWAGERTEEQINNNLFTDLTGHETGLLALWNFADGTARDASPNGRDGKFIGNAKVVVAQRPAAAELSRPAIITGRVTDEAGNPVPDTRVRLEQDGNEITTVAVGADGAFRHAWMPNGQPYDIEAVSKEGKDAWRLGVAIAGGQTTTLNFTLRPALTISGTVFSLDTNTPLAGVVVQLLKVGPSKNTPAPGAAQESPTDRPMGSTLSDDKGKYSFTNIRPGTYRLRCHVADGFIEHTNQVVLAAEAAPARAPQTDFQTAPFRKGTWKNYTTLDGLASDETFGLEFDRSGRLWIATFLGASRFDGTAFTTLSKADGLQVEYVTALAEGPDAAMWFGHQNGLTRWGDRKTEIFTKTNGLPSRYVNAIYRDDQGAVWVGTMGGLARYQDGRFTRFTTTNGLAAATVTSIAGSRDGSVWIGTQNGLSRYRDAHMTTFRTKDGLVDNRVMALRADFGGG